MPPIPGTKKIPRFIKEIRGSFGRFKTDDSYALQYLNTSIPANEIGALQTASELFPVAKTDFEELVQRDIDHARVRKIANEYLCQGTNRVIFFPPLLACVLLVDENGNHVSRYQTTEQIEHIDEEGNSLIRTTWDGDGFELDIPVADTTSSDRFFELNGKKVFIYEYAALLKLNPRRAKLVVLDGQHRLEAIRLLHKNSGQNNVISGIELPVCIVWAADATQEKSPDESLTKDFRELFVRVNSEPRRVSGHFITLLKDDSYSAMSVRRLADKWKATETGGWSRLHLLEWNTREDERADVRTRESSITTVSILAKSLDDHLFSAGIAPLLLGLEQSADQFEAIDSDFSWQGLRDKTQKPPIDSIVRRHIESALVPALDILLRTPSPYSTVENALSAAFERLRHETDNNKISFIALKANIIDRYIYSEQEILEQSTLGAYCDFRRWIAPDPSSKIFLLAVFQQAFIRTWLEIASASHQFGITAQESAKMTVAALEALVFDKVARFLGEDKKYTRRTLWRNESVNYSSTWAKKAWFDLTCASLMSPKARAAAIACLARLDSVEAMKLDAALLGIGEDHFSEYGARFRDEIYKDTKQRLADFFEEEMVTQLKFLQHSSNKKDRHSFETTVRTKSDTRVKDALESLASQLQTPQDSLLRNVDFG